MPERPHNAPPVPLSPIGELADWHLTIRCRACQRRVMLPVSGFVTSHGPALALWRLVSRLRCRSPTRRGGICGSRPDRVSPVLGRERRKDFLVYREITVLDDRLRIND